MSFHFQTQSLSRSLEWSTIVQHRVNNWLTKCRILEHTRNSCIISSHTTRHSRDLSEEFLLINFYRSIIIRILRCAAVEYFFLHTIRFRFGCCWSEIITNNLILPFFYIYCVHISHEERHKQLQIRRESNSTWIDEKWTQVPHWFQLRDGTITFKRLFYKSRSTPQGPVN